MVGWLVPPTHPPTHPPAGRDQPAPPTNLSFLLHLTYFDLLTSSGARLRPSDRRDRPPPSRSVRKDNLVAGFLFAYLEEWCIKHPTRDAVVQIMCSPETAAAVLLPETAVLAPKAAAAVLLLHADPGMRDCLQNGKRSEVLVNLDAGGSTQFVVGTTSALPNAASLFTSRTGHACKAPVDSLDNKWTTIRDPHTVCLYLEPVGKHKAPHLLRMSLRGYQILRQASSFDGRLLGGNCFYDGRPVVHTGNPDQADGVTVRAANGSMAQTCCSQDTSPCKMQVLLA